MLAPQNWIYPTYSDDYGEPDRSTEFSEQQLAFKKNTINPQYLKRTFFNTFSSKDLVAWEKHSHIGDEVVQLYMNDLVSSMTTPEIELKGFDKIHLEPQETKTVEFTLGFDELLLCNLDMEKVVEPRSFKIMIGKSCKNIVL